MLRFFRKIPLYLYGLNLVSGVSASAHADQQLFPEPVYVTLRDSAQVLNLDGLQSWQVGPQMLYTSLTPDGKTLVVSSPKEGGIYIVSTSDGKPLSMVKTGKAAKGLKITPNGKEVFVSNEGANTISVVDLATQRVVATIKTEPMPHNVRFTVDGDIAYVTLQGGAGLGVIDVKSRRMLKVIATPGINNPHNLDLSLDGKLAFIRDTSNVVGVLDLQSGNMKTLISVGQGHAGIDVIPNGKLVFTGAIADDVVSVIDATSFQLIKQIKVGFGPHGVRASADSKFVYVTVTADDKVYVISTTSLTVVKELAAASFPFWVAVKGNP